MEFETNRLVAACVRNCIDDGYFRAQNVDLIAYQVVMVAHGWALKRWVLGQAMTLEEYVAAATEMFLHGAMTGVGWKHWSKANLQFPSDYFWGREQ
jgi:hypothetical protein